jgi:LTXXQ motif family protein
MMTQARPTRIAFAFLALVALMTAPIAAQPMTPPEPDVPAGSEVRWSQCNLQLELSARAFIAGIDRAMRPTETQRAAFNELRIAVTKAFDILQSTCQAERVLTPAEGLEAAEKMLEARLQAIRIVRPALDTLYNLLSDEQRSHVLSQQSWVNYSWLYAGQPQR